jgi:hypothetical protein
LDVPFNSPSSNNNITYIKGRMKLPLNPNGQDSSYAVAKYSEDIVKLPLNPSSRPSVHPSGRPCESTPWKLRGCRLGGGRWRVAQHLPFSELHITYSKGRRDEMKLSIHPSRHPSHHPSKQNIFLKREKTRKKLKTEKTL